MSAVKLLAAFAFGVTTGVIWVIFTLPPDEISKAWRE